MDGFEELDPLLYCPLIARSIWATCRNDLVLVGVRFEWLVELLPLGKQTCPLGTIRKHAYTRNWIFCWVQNLKRHIVHFVYLSVPWHWSEQPPSLSYLPATIKQIDKHAVLKVVAFRTVWAFGLSPANLFVVLASSLPHVYPSSHLTLKCIVPIMCNSNQRYKAQLHHSSAFVSHREGRERVCVCAPACGGGRCSPLVAKRMIWRGQWAHAYVWSVYL